jgi:pimeloyl-ACP methyl ester carboxylesterase
MTGDDPGSPKSPLIDRAQPHEPATSSAPAYTAAAVPAPASATAACCAEVCGRCCLPAAAPRAARALSCLHAAAWCAAIATMVLLLGGAGTVAEGWRRFPPRGTVYSVALAAFAGSEAGDAQRVHLWCSGAPANASRPTVLLDFGGGGHSMSDVYGLRLALLAGGRRVCALDPVGTGWSPLGPAFNGEEGDASASHAELLASLLAQAREPGPFVLVGSMDGAAERIYRVALERPALVRALVPMQYSGVGEFAPAAAYFGYSEAQAEATARAALAPRLAFCDAIRFLGVQWGVVGLFAPHSPTFVPQELEGEKNFLNLFHEGQWDMQCRILAAQVRRPSLALAQSLWTSNRSLAAAIPVLAIDNPGPDPCAGGAGAGAPPPGSDACAVARLGQSMGTAYMRSMANMTAGSRFMQCADKDVCADWLGGGSSVPFVARAVLDFMSDIGA